MSDNQNKNKDTTLSLGKFEVFSDIDESQIGFIVSYTGNQFNHCGILIKATSSVSAEDIHKVIQISNSKNSDVGQIITEQIRGQVLFAPISTDPTTNAYAEFFTISTRNGQLLSSVFAELSDQYLISAIVEVMQCK